MILRLKPRARGRPRLAPRLSDLKCVRALLYLQVCCISRSGVSSEAEVDQVRCGMRSEDAGSSRSGVRSEDFVTFHSSVMHEVAVTCRYSVMHEDAGAFRGDVKAEIIFHVKNGASHYDVDVQDVTTFYCV